MTVKEFLIVGSLVGVLGFVGNRYFKKRSEDRRVAQNIETTAKKITEAMKNDAASEVAVKIFKRTIALASAQPVSAELKALCNTQATCPYRMDQFYLQTLRRLPTDELASARLIIQTAMMHSDLALKKKAVILYASLASAGVKSAAMGRGPASAAPPTVGSTVSELEFLKGTQIQVLSLDVDPSFATNVTMEAVKRTHDRPTQLALVRRLKETYPQYDSFYKPQFSAMGLFQ